MHALNDRQERFVHEYLIDHNASAAAVRAGYSPKTKGTQAAELMKDARVQARIAIEMGELFARLKVSAFELLRKQVCALNFDPARLFDAEGKPLPLAQMDEETKAGLSVSFEERGGERVVKARQTPRHVALAALWRRFDAFQKVQAKALEVLAVQEKEEAREVELDVQIEGQKIWVEARLQEYAKAKGEARAREEARLRQREGAQESDEAREPEHEAQAAAVPRVPPDLTNLFPWQREINDARARKAREREAALQAVAPAPTEEGLAEAGQGRDYEAAVEKVRLAEAEVAQARAEYERVRREAAREA
jgi:phage terminase small subunit